MARGDLTPQEIELRKIISNNINSLLDIKNKKQIDVISLVFLYQP